MKRMGVEKRMGCSNSKTTMSPLHLCEQRKRFVKEAIDSRCALAAAHVSYIRSLRNIGVCLRQYAETEESSSSVVDESEEAMPLPAFSPPQPPNTSSWDYFYKDCDPAVVIGLDKFRQGNVAKCGSYTALQDTEQRKQSCEDPSEFITHRAKDFVSSMIDIEHEFFRASQSGKEVSRMLEANKLGVQFTGKGNSIAFLADLKRACSRGNTYSQEKLKHQATKVIAWKRTSSSRSSTSRNPLIQTSAEEEEDPDEESKSDFVGMISGSHSSSLDRLYAWETNLYEEIKASEMLRKEYDQKCDKLKNQFTKDDSAKSMDKTKAAAKDLHFSIQVTIKSIDSISKRIEKIRDEELQPQLFEFLQGLIRMWKAMLDCHHSQYITISLAYHCPNSSKREPENILKRRVLSELLVETECFGLSFLNLVKSMTSYVKSLNGWLHSCVLLPQERSIRNGRPWSPRRVLAPPIFVLCRDWLAGIKCLPSDELNETITGFSSDIEMLGEEKDGSVLVSDMASVAKLLERLKKYSEASLKMYEDVKVKSEAARVAYTNKFY